MEHEFHNTQTEMFAIMWDCQGLEACVKVPGPAEMTFALLKGVDPPRLPNLEHWKLRAKFNSHRHYEIYIITAQSGIDEDNIVDMFNACPQTAADTVRNIGQCIYSDRANNDKILIR